MTCFCLLPYWPSLPCPRWPGEYGLATAAGWRGQSSWPSARRFLEHRSSCWGRRPSGQAESPRCKSLHIWNGIQIGTHTCRTCINMWKKSSQHECQEPQSLQRLLWQPRGPFLCHGIIKPAAGSVAVNKRRWEAVHWRALMVTYGRVNCHIRSQVPGQKREEEDQVTHKRFDQNPQLFLRLVPGIPSLWFASYLFMKLSAGLYIHFIMWQKSHCALMAVKKLLVDQPGDDCKLWQLLFPGLRPNVVCRYVSGPVDPVPGSGSSGVFQQVLNCPQRQVTLAVGSPVPGLSMPPAG